MFSFGSFFIVCNLLALSSHLEGLSILRSQDDGLIVHRDLKPANILVTKDGICKVRVSIRVDASIHDSG